jgi:hypothetical protein
MIIDLTSHDTSAWPEMGTRALWARTINVSIATLAKYYRMGRLRGERWPGNFVMHTKEEIMECFDLRPKRRKAKVAK